MGALCGCKPPWPPLEQTTPWKRRLLLMCAYRGTFLLLLCINQMRPPFCFWIYCRIFFITLTIWWVLYIYLFVYYYYYYFRNLLWRISDHLENLRGEQNNPAHVRSINYEGASLSPLLLFFPPGASDTQGPQFCNFHNNENRIPKLGHNWFCLLF